ncbi:quinol:cytochrome C oxidoreductase [Elizabethkingia sp. JS20170427COW]|uniref:quinol:cytochrome C oxidoreductase n=1 Tax=Elizabethkingia sp. JS20170427COW TaxID=2583851 RepID=UPI001110E0ED|nr:quinol:cytochrome C oxidoreductase [Elizabethkingia sp. JS20170427COW]QCX53280.1 quinol:cytochrome C oxidoreductase [Elizabethkingia sp. JS20170427COW]
MYSFSPKLRLYSIIMLVVGLVLFGIGYSVNHSIDEAKIEQIAAENHIDIVHGTKSNSAQLTDHSPKQHMETAIHQAHNEPMAALLQVSVFAFGIACAALFFYAIQNAAHAGWPIIVLRVMEAIASFIPYGGILMIIIVLANTIGLSHLYHWMDGSLTDPNSEHFDVIVYEKSKYLNIPFYIVRTLIYVIGATFFVWKLKSLSKKVDETKSRAVYAKYYSWNVGYIAFFGFCSAAWAWDWMMSIDTHWYSTLYIWYTMVSCLSTAVAVMILISVMLKKKGVLPQFNDNHLHDLGVYLFATSMLWSYLWFSQFMLYWYANIPEEVNYFLGRFNYYEETFITTLIPNFLIPLLVLVSSSIKRNYKVVTTVAVIVIIGHWFDYFNIIMPGTVGPFWNIGLLEIGATLFVLGLFIFTVMTALSKLKLIPTGNPFLHESEIYEYPF